MNNEEIKAKVKEIRALTGLSQTKFAERYNIPRSTIRAWELGARKPPQWVLEMVEKIVRMDLLN